MIPHRRDWRRWCNELSKCEVTREGNFGSFKKMWCAGNLKNSSRELKCSNFFIARTLPLSCQRGQIRPYLTAFSLPSHLVVSINGNIIKHFGPGTNWSLRRYRSSHLLTVPETPGTTLSLQPLLLLLLLLANTLGYLVLQNTRNYISVGVMPFLLL